VRIGISLVDLAIGGAQTFLAQLAAGLDERGHHIYYYLFASQDNPTYATPSLISTFNRHAEKVARPVDLHRCEAIQLDGYHSIWKKLPYLKVLDRCVETYQSAYSIKRSGPFYLQHRVCSSRYIQGLFGRPARLIYQGVPRLIGPLNSERSYDLAILGRIHPVKGHLLFLEICERLFKAQGRLSAALIGGYPEMGPYQRLVQSKVAELINHGVEVCQTGDLAHSEVYDWLKQVKILLVTSTDEGFGRMALEALACETAVIANPVGGLLEIIQDGQTGLFAKRDDPQSFAQLTARILKDPALRVQLARQGREMVARHFSLDAMLDQYETLYQQIAQGG